jgi:tetratricopeptide (TPR) repeat protein
MEAADARLVEAREAVHRHEYALAYRLYEGALQERPESLQAPLDFGRAKFREYEDLEGATTLFERALALAPESVEVLLWTAYFYSLGYGPGYGTANYAAAAALYRQALHLDPQSVDAYIGLGLSHGSPGHPVSLPEAIDAYRTASQLDPTRRDAFSNLGNALIEADEREQARVALTKAHQLFAQHGDETRVNSIQQLLDRLDRNEDITGFAYMYDSKMFRWPDEP